ncbi:MAG: WD40/YVTN/BNR-like repeat-containing protein [Candidatus Dormibacteria bacterium]
MAAFASADDEVYVLTSQPGTGGGTYRFERSLASSNDWQTLPIPFGPGSQVTDLEAHGSSVWLLGASAMPSPGMRNELAHSTNEGASFATVPGPCIPGLGGTLAPDSSTVVWAVCPTGMAAGAWRSVDAGTSFIPLATGELPNSAELAPATDTTALLAANNGTSGLLRTINAGETWTLAAAPASGDPIMFLGFTDAEVGAALVSIGAGTQSQLWRTTDGGAVWSVVLLG